MLAIAVLVLAASGTAAAAAAVRSPSVQARSALVGIGATGQVLWALHPGRRLPMASITKLMTALVVLEHARPDDVVRVAGPAPAVGGSQIGLVAGERITVGDLLVALLVQSANDAAMALAYHVGRGSVPRFVRMMNEKASALRLRGTHFARPDGLDAAGHHSSAQDLFKLGRIAMHKPFIRRTVRIRTTTIAGGRSLRTWNDLLFTYPGAVGVKTGHTSGAGWCEVAAARRGNVTVYAVLLGGPSRGQRNADLVEMLDWGFAREAASAPRGLGSVTGGLARPRFAPPPGWYAGRAFGRTVGPRGSVIGLPG